MKGRRLGKGFWLVAGFLVAFLGFGLWGSTVAWRLAGNSKMSVHGYVALGLGVGFSLLLGFGLMGLAFFSSRRGWDDDQRR
jgi:hypothetical protein